LSKWTTKEQRECGRQLLKIHAGDLPDLDEVVAESRRYLADITARLTPIPQPHVGHGHLSAWFEAAKGRMKNRRQTPPVAPEKEVRESAPAPLPLSPPRGRKGLRAKMLDGLRVAYSRTFGSPPQVGTFHPLWLDTDRVNKQLAEWKKNGARVLWLTSRDSLFHSVLRDRLDTAALFLEDPAACLFAAPYDACLCELAVDELVNLSRLYAKIRPLILDGGKVVFLVANRDRSVAPSDMALCQTALPDVDVSEIRFYGSAATDMLRRLYLRASNSFANRPLSRVLATGAVLIGLAPFVRLANALASRRDPTLVTSHWTSLVVSFTVRKASAAGLPDQSGRPSGDGMPTPAVRSLSR
jgi:hypothetical protein